MLVEVMTYNYASCTDVVWTTAVLSKEFPVACNSGTYNVCHGGSAKAATLQYPPVSTATTAACQVSPSLLHATAASD